MSSIRKRMIEEIRIMSKTGANIFSGKINLESNEVVNSDTDVLFAGFISAILSVSEELQNSDIRELGYQENKIIFTMTDNLIFLGFCDSKVPNNDILILLDEVIRRWMAVYKDQEYPFVPSEMRDNIINLVKGSITDVFWWASPKFNIGNSFKLVKNSFFNPSGSYYVQYLPNSFLLVGLLVFAISLVSSLLLESVLTGFGAGQVEGGENNIFIVTLINMFLLTFTSGLLLQIFYRNQFKLAPYILLSSIFSIMILGVIFIASPFYVNFFSSIYSSTENSPLVQYLVYMFLFFGPLNICYFGYFMLLGYSSSLNQNIPITQFLGAYIFSQLIVISIAEFIAGTIYGINLLG